MRAIFWSVLKYADYPKVKQNSLKYYMKYPKNLKISWITLKFVEVS